MSKKSRKGCFKFGCFGCLAVFALGVGLLLLLGAIQLSMDDQEPNPEQRAASHDLPPAPGLPVLPELTEFPGDDQVDVPRILPLPEGVEPPSVAAGTLILDLSMGEFEIRPGPAGEPIRVEADYDTNAFELTEDFTEDAGGAWTYEVKFSGKGGLLGALFRGGGNASRNRVEVIIPRGRPVEIVGQIGMGESQTDLGGLWVERVDLKYKMGDHFLEFREPLPYPMKEFLIDSSMGGVEIRGLGEASPAVVDVHHGMGELHVDLEGHWRRDATVDIDFSMGECRLYLPRNARVDIARASVGLGEKQIDRRDRQDDLPADAPLLTLNLTGNMGELRVED